MSLLDWELGISTNTLGDRRLEVSQLKILEKAGVRYFEFPLKSSHFDLDDRDLIKAIKEYLRNSSLECWAIHSTSGENHFSRFTGSHQESSLSVLKKCVEVATQLAVRRLVIHPGGPPIPEEARPKWLSQSKEGLNRLVEFAKGSGVKLALENLESPRRFLGKNFQEIDYLVSGFDPEALGVCLDMNHVFEDQIDDFIKGLGKRLTTLHISDNNGRSEQHWLPMQGVIDWGKVVSTLRNVGYQGAFM